MLWNILLRQIKSERDLPICETAETVCSVLQKRYWLPSVLSRYCRCPGSVECPTDWASPEVVTTNETSALSQKKFGINYSLQLNNRAQLKVKDNSIKYYYLKETKEHSSCPKSFVHQYNH